MAGIFQTDERSLACCAPGKRRGRYCASATIGALAILLVSLPSAAQSSQNSYRGWVGGFAGITADSGGDLTIGWEAWVSAGRFGVGYQRHFVDDFEGTRKNAHALLPGVLLPYGRAIGRLAAGVAALRRCDKDGEQSGEGTCRAGTTAEFAVSVDVALTPSIGFHTSYFAMPNRDLGQSGVVFGLSVGRLSLSGR